MAPSHPPTSTRSGGQERGSFRSMVAAVVTIGGGQLVAQVLTLVLLVTITHDDAAALGITAVYYGVAMALTPLLDAGASTRLLRDGGLAGLGLRDRAAVRGLVLTKPAVAIVPVVAVVAVTGDLALGCALAYPVVRGPGLVAQALWQVDGVPRRSALLAVGERAGALVLGLCAWYAGCSAPVACTAGLLAGAAIAAAAAVPRLRATVHETRTARPGAVFGYGLHFAGASVAGNLVLLDSVVVAMVAGPVAAGQYALGARLLGPVLVLTGAASGALLPALAAGERAAVKTLRLLGLASLAGLAVVFVFVPVLLPVLAGPAFVAALPAVRCYLVAAACVLLAQLLVLRLQAAGDEMAVSVILPGGVLLGLAAAGLGAATASQPAVGAAVGYGLACVLVTALLAYRVTRRQSDERQRDGDRDVPARGVAEAGEEHVPQRRQHEERLGERAAPHGVGEPAHGEHDHQDPEGEPGDARGDPAAEHGGVHVQRLRQDERDQVVAVDGIAVVHQPVHGGRLHLGRHHGGGPPPDPR